MTVTEREEALDHLTSTVTSNKKTSWNIETKILDWTKVEDFDPVQDYDILIGADIIYIEDTFEYLLKTLLTFTKSNTPVLLSMRIRYERDEKFLDMMRNHFELSRIFHDRERGILIYKAVRN